MKRNLFLVSAIAIATLASCTKESELDQTIVSAESAQIPIEFSTYASAATTTKGTAVNSNKEFQENVGSFDVMALVSDGVFEYTHDNGKMVTGCTAVPEDGDAVKYFNFYTVNYVMTDSDSSDDSTPYPKWVNSHKMYWPNSEKIMHFAAYSPSSLELKDDEATAFTVSASGGVETYNYTFPYKVNDEVASQIDLMYAIHSLNYASPADRAKSDAAYDNSYVTTGVDYTNNEESVNLHFKHALTQIAFTATKDSDIEVYVKSITICNVYNEGTFTATSITDDADTYEEEDGDTGTVGNTEMAGDRVDADKFGIWTTDFDASGSYGGWTNVSDTKKSTWTSLYANEAHPSMSNYGVPFLDFTVGSPNRGDDEEETNSIRIGDSGVTSLSSDKDVLMLKPQELTAWTPNTATEPNCIGIINDDDPNVFVNVLDGSAISSSATESLSYLAIDCEIYHDNIDAAGAKIHSGYIFVPFDTKGIKYSEAATDNQADDADEWLAGYRITYCLNFGGGYIVDEDNHDGIPTPGTVPDTETYTLRTITYTTSIDNWVDVEQDKDLLDFENGVDTDTSHTPS